MRSLLYALVALLALPALASAETDARTGNGVGSPRTGIEASVPSTRQPGAYNNYCQTWRDTRAKDRALFGACLTND